MQDRPVSAAQAAARERALRSMVAHAAGARHIQTGGLPSPEAHPPAATPEKSRERVNRFARALTWRQWKYPAGPVPLTWDIAGSEAGE